MQKLLPRKRPLVRSAVKQVREQAGGSDEIMDLAAEASAKPNLALNTMPLSPAWPGLRLGPRGCQQTHGKALACCRFVNKPLDFDDFMDVAAAAGAEPYLVLNYDSANKPGQRWDYDQLRDAAESWVSYIVRKGYQARALSHPKEGPAAGCQESRASHPGRPVLHARAILQNLGRKISGRGADASGGTGVHFNFGKKAMQTKDNDQATTVQHVNITLTCATTYTYVWRRRHTPVMDFGLYTRSAPNRCAWARR